MTNPRSDLRIEEAATEDDDAAVRHQARPFYEKLGYELFGTLEGYPAGTRQHHLFKRLDPTRSPLADHPG
jgi:hypothetical protein